MMLVADRSASGQPATGPSGVADQSSARMRSPMPPPPDRNVGWLGCGSAGGFPGMGMGPARRGPDTAVADGREGERPDDTYRSAQPVCTPCRAQQTLN